MKQYGRQDIQSWYCHIEEGSFKFNPGPKRKCVVAAKAKSRVHSVVNGCEHVKYINREFR